MRMEMVCMVSLVFWGEVSWWWLGVEGGRRDGTDCLSEWGEGLMGVRVWIVESEDQALSWVNMLSIYRSFGDGLLCVVSTGRLSA